MTVIASNRRMDLVSIPVTASCTLARGDRHLRSANRRTMGARHLALACAALLATASVAQAAQQCFSQAGTYGALTVTEAGPGCGTFLSFGGITNGLYMGNNNTTEACTFSFSPAVVGSTVRVTLTAHSCNGTSYCEEARFALNGAHYAVAPADLVTPFGSGSPVQITAAGDIVEAPGGGSAGSGVITFNSAPASVSSITIDHVVTLGAPAGTIYEVCADDAGSGAAATTTAVTSSLNPSGVGQAVTFTATVTGISPTGTVQFRDGAANLGAPVALAGGTAALSTSSLTAGTHVITAAYGGDADDAPSTSPALTQVVTAATPVAEAIPTLSVWALALLSAVLAGLGFAKRRRS